MKTRDNSIACNSCSEPMVLFIDDKSAKCTVCPQVVGVGIDGHFGQTLVTLYPSKITDSGMMLEYGKHKVAEWEFFDRLSVAFGMITETEREERLVTYQEQLERFIESAVAPLRRKWWQ